MTSPTWPAPDRFAATASWTAGILADAPSWTWDDATLKEYAQILAGIDTAVAYTDLGGIQRAYQDLVRLGGRVRYAGRADQPAAPDGRFPYQRTNELVHRLRTLPTPTTDGTAEPPRHEPPHHEEPR